MARIIDLKNKENDEELETFDEGKSDVAITEEMEYVSDSLEPLSWRGPLIHHLPDMRYVVGTSVVMFAMAVLSVFFQRSFIASAFFAFFGVMILVKAKRQPHTAFFTVTPLGVSIDEKIYNFRNIASFWIAYDPYDQLKELSIHVKSWYMPYIKIPIGDINPVHLRQILIKFIPEIEHEETLIEIIARKIGL